MLNSFVGRHPFAKVAANNDTKRKARLQGRSQEEMEYIEHQRKWVVVTVEENYFDTFSIQMLCDMRLKKLILIGIQNIVAFGCYLLSGRGSRSDQ